jgi:putative FmdB family regulatory protein
MPVYEYACDECGERFDVFFRSITQRTSPCCPKCGSDKVRKALSLFGVGSKGGGGVSAGASCGPSPT